MAPPATGAANHDGQPRAYTEHLSVPWYWWPIGLLLAGIAAAEVGLGASGTRGWLPFAVILPAAMLGIGWLGRIKISIATAEGGGEELRVDDARLPLSVIADAIPLDAAGRRELLGVSADPLAFVIARPWITGAVQVVLDDQDDPTPYWVISSRHPRRLAAALAPVTGTECGSAPQPQVPA